MIQSSELRDFDHLDMNLLQEGDVVKMEIGGKVYDVIRLADGLEFAYIQSVQRIRGMFGVVTKGEPVDLRPHANVCGFVTQIRGIVKYKLHHEEESARRMPEDSDFEQLRLDV